MGSEPIGRTPLAVASASVVRPVMPAWNQQPQVARKRSRPCSGMARLSALAGASGVAKVLSGGTDLLVQLRTGRIKPDLIVDTKKIPGMLGIKANGGGFTIGASTPCLAIGDHEALSKSWPGLVEGACLIGLGDVVRAEGNKAAARAFYEQALPLFERFGDPVSEGICRERIASVPNSITVRAASVTEPDSDG